MQLFMVAAVAPVHTKAGNCSNAWQCLLVKIAPILSCCHHLLCKMNDAVCLLGACSMSDLALPFVLLLEDDALAFWCFASLMAKVSL